MISKPHEDDSGRADEWPRPGHVRDPGPGANGEDGCDRAGLLLDTAEGGRSANEWVR